MQITDLRMETYRWPGTPMFSGGRFVFGSDGLDLLRVETDEGITGVGLTWVHEASGSVVRGIAQHLKQHAVGKDPLDNERIWDDMWRLGQLGRRGIGTQVLSAIDIALWDIKGKVAGMPLYKLLGGYTDRIPAYISMGFRGEGPDMVASSLQDGVARGARAIKMQIGNASTAEDVERVRVARETVGPDVKLMLDASTLYRHQEAIVVASKLEKYDIFWIEEPVAPDDMRGSRLVAEATSIPIATGEGEYTRYGFRDLIEDRCASILQPDALIMGGITEFMKVAAMAQANDLHIFQSRPTARTLAPDCGHSKRPYHRRVLHQRNAAHRRWDIRRPAADRRWTHQPAGPAGPWHGAERDGDSQVPDGLNGCHPQAACGSTSSPRTGSGPPAF